MSNPSKEKKKQLFQQELGYLKNSKAILDDPDVPQEKVRAGLETLVDNYEELLDQSKLITKVSDRQQKKIIRTTSALEQKNLQLTETIDALTEAKVGRKATTVALGIAITLFLLAEGLIEPQIDGWVLDHDLGAYNFDNINVIGLALKAVLALLIRPIEKIVEKKMMADALKKKAERNT